MASQFDDTVVRGSFRVTAGNPVTLPDSSVAGAAIAGGIAAEKVMQRVVERHSQDGTAASQTIGIHRADGAGEIVSMKAWFVESKNIGAATVDIDLLKNGSSILTADLETDSTAPSAVNVDVDGSLSSDTYADGDHFAIDIVATAGGGTLGAGLVVEVVFKEEFAG